MSDNFAGTWEMIKGVVGGVIEFWTEIFHAFVALFKGDTDEAMEHFKGAWDALKDVFSTFFGFVWDKFDELMGKLLGDKWDKFKDLINNVVDAVKGYFSGLVEALGGMWDVIVGIFTGDTDLINSGFKDIVNGLVEKINSIVRLAYTISFDLPDWLGGGSFGFNLPEIPRLAEGGIVRKPTLAMIGESGPEAVVPLGQGGGGMGANITINIMGATYGFDDFENKVAEAIKDGVRRGGFQRIIN